MEDATISKVPVLQLIQNGTLIIPISKNIYIECQVSEKPFTGVSTASPRRLLWELASHLLSVTAEAQAMTLCRGHGSGGDREKSTGEAMLFPICVTQWLYWA